MQVLLCESPPGEKWNVHNRSGVGCGGGCHNSRMSDHAHLCSVFVSLGTLKLQYVSEASASVRPYVQPSLSLLSYALLPAALHHAFCRLSSISHYQITTNKSL